jgi:phytoene dehydrogenase-like protein
MNAIAEQLGEVGLPAPLKELAAQQWDAVIVGGGHNGLTAAAYLAKAGQKVLVLERRERLGGACTLERPFSDPDFIVSPCAYVVGLLDDLVIRELQLKQRGLHVHVADPNLWVPFPDGTSFGQWLDDDRTQADLDALGVSAKDQKGYWAYEHLFDEIRKRLRTGERDTWIGESPSRAELEELLHGEQTMIDVLFDASIAEVLDDHFSDQRLKDALFGQGIIGAWAGPHDKGTASIKLMHYQGDLEGGGPIWGYVRGGMGMISFAIADAAQEAGATLATGVPVAEIVPEEGVVLEDGTRIRATTVVCNADPKVALRLLGDEAPADFRERLRPGSCAAPSSSSTPRSTASRPGPPRPARTSPPAARSTSPPASTPPRKPSSAAPRARPPSASARSTCRPFTTRARRPPATTSSACSASTRPTTSTGTAAATRWRASSST